jgi:hypothetical protein
MRRLLVLFAALVAAAACAGDSSHQVWVVNERAEPVVVVLEVLTGDLGSAPAEILDYTIPANSEGCTYCGSGSLPSVRAIVYAAQGCVQLGAAVMIGESAYVITVPTEGLVILEPGGRPPDPSRGLQIHPVATECG